MIELLIERKWPKVEYTIGAFSVNGERLCESLEDTDRGLVSSMPTGVINTVKVYGKTAIPKGRYRVVLSVSPKFNGRTWGRKYRGLVPEVLGVKGFSGVRIHPGNKASDTLGCPLVGRNKKVGELVESTACYYALMDKYLIPAHERGEEIWLTIQ
ncbi:MAG: hypothetical protein IK114_14235 [Fibrobacter sp.]|nr:hypothetical protein [Fibrobacter sp.]